jgi:hypothetical protein
MYFTVYKITNLINGKVYVGVHKTTNLNDSYMGSGPYLKQSIRKHGINNFKKEYLHIFDNADDMFQMESLLVDADFVNSCSSYNLKLGGSGGWDHVKNSTEKLSEYGRLGAEKIIEKMKDPSYRKIRAANLSAAMKQSYASGKLKGYVPKNNFKGKHHTETTKRKMRTSQKGKHNGKLNSQFGTMWITDRVSNKKISKDDPIPEGWMKGRITKKQLGV